MALFRAYKDAEVQANGNVHLMIGVYKTGDDPDGEGVIPIDHFTAVLDGNAVNAAFALPTDPQRNERLKELVQAVQGGRIAKVLVSEEAARNLNSTFTWPIDFEVA